MKHVDIPETEKSNLTYLMTAGYHALREASAATGLDGTVLRSMIAKRKFGKQNWPDLSPSQYAAVLKARPAVLEVFAAQDRLIAGYQRLVSRVVRQVRNVNSMLGYEDAVQEANLALIDSFFGFDGSQPFVSFAAGNIRRRLLRIGGTLGSVGKAGRKTFRVRCQVQAEAARSGKSYEAVLDDLGVTGHLRDMVLTSLAGVVRSGVDGDGHDALDNLTGRELDPAEEAAESEERRDAIAVVTAALERGNLTQVERDVVLRSMEGDAGWQIALAEERGVSRQAVSYAYNKALGKLKGSITELLA